MQDIIYTTEKCEEEIIDICRKYMDGTVKLNKFAYWGDDDVTFNLVLEKFGVDLSDIDCPVEPIRNFHR